MIDFSGIGSANGQRPESSCVSSRDHLLKEDLDSPRSQEKPQELTNEPFLRETSLLTDWKCLQTTQEQCQVKEFHQMIPLN